MSGLAPPDRHKFEEVEVQISDIDRFDDSHPGVNDPARGKKQVSDENLTSGRSTMMATLYTRRFNLKDSLSDEEIVSHWRWLLGEFAPVVAKVSGVHSVKLYSRHGALRADLSIAAELDDAAVYERLLVDAEVRKHLGRFYGAIDLKTSEQAFRREVTTELINALSSTG